MTQHLDVGEDGGQHGLDALRHHLLVLPLRHGGDGGPDPLRAPIPARPLARLLCAPLRYPAPGGHSSRCRRSSLVLRRTRAAARGARLAAQLQRRCIGLQASLPPVFAASGAHSRCHPGR